MKKKAFTTSRAAQAKTIPVGDYASFHRQVANIDMHGMPGPVNHLDAERRKRGLVAGFGREKAQRLLGKRVECFLKGKVRLAPRDRASEERRGVHGVVARLTLHQC